jgi:hypothetical protein
MLGSVRRMRASSLESCAQGGWWRLNRWAQLEGDAAVRKMALNVGRRPSWGEGAEVTVEAHLLHSYPDDFYGRHLRVLVSGFLRCPHCGAIAQPPCPRLRCRPGAVHACKQGALHALHACGTLCTVSVRMDQGDQRGPTAPLPAVHCLLESRVG